MKDLSKDSEICFYRSKDGDAKIDMLAQPVISILETTAADGKINKDQD